MAYSSKIKQYSLKQPIVQRSNHKGSKEYFALENHNEICQNMYSEFKAVLRGKNIVLNIFIGNEVS